DKSKYDRIIFPFVFYEFASNGSGVLKIIKSIFLCVTFATLRLCVRNFYTRDWLRYLFSPVTINW
ncbi:MAG: hypothetical protein ACT6FF_09435, partial [Methanosarcinaceae archaeon]